jgi:hypothetical protein
MLAFVITELAARAAAAREIIFDRFESDSNDSNCWHAALWPGLGKNFDRFRDDAETTFPPINKNSD